MTKTDFDVKLSSLNRKITSNKAKHLLFENELKGLKTLDWVYIIGKVPFGEDGIQNHLVFQPMRRYFKIIAGVVTFITGNLKHCLMKELTRLIIALLQT